MASISENLQLLRNTKTAIKDAIIGKGGSIDDATAFAEYAIAIENLPSGGGEDYSEYPNVPPTDDPVYVATTKNGVIVVSSNTLGLVRIYNGTVTKVADTICDQLFTTDTEIFAGNSTSATLGVYRISADFAGMVITSSYNWKSFNVASNGNVYMSSNETKTGIWEIQPNNTVSNYLSGEGYAFTTFVEANGKIYLASVSILATGIWVLENGSTRKINSSDYGFSYPYVDKMGKVYLTRGTSSYKGLWVIQPDDTVTVILTDYYLLKVSFEDNYGNVYVSSTNASSGVWRVLPDLTTERVVSANYYNFKYMFADNFGNIIMSSANNNSGIWFLPNGESKAYQVLTTGSNYNTFATTTDGSNFISSQSTSGVYDIHMGDDGKFVATKALSTGHYPYLVNGYYAPYGMQTVYALSNDKNGIFDFIATGRKIDNNDSWQLLNGRYVNTNETKEFLPETGEIVDYEHIPQEVYKIAVVKAMV